MSIRRIAIAAVALALCTASARAEIIITIEQQGNDVVATGSGTINLTDLINPTQTTAFTGVILPIDGYIVEGPPSLSGPVTEFSGISGPSSFGGPPANATTGFGDEFGIWGSLQTLIVPQGYTTGSSLSGTDTYSGQTISSLGLTPGTYTWTWGTGANADSLTVRIGAVAVPEPSTAILAVSGAVAFVAYGWSRHRREQRQQRPG